MAGKRSGTLNDAHIRRPGDDEFHYRDYIKPLATQLRTATPPFTLGIFGGWGQGKTGLMHLLAERLKQSKENIVTIWFDAWKFDREDAIWRALLSHTINALEERLDEAQDEADADRKKAIAELRGKQLEPLKQQLYRSFTQIEKGPYAVNWQELPKQLLLLGVQAALPGGSLVTKGVEGIGAIGELVRSWFGSDEERKAGTVESNDDPANVDANLKTLENTLALIKREESQTYFEHIQHLEQFHEKFRELTELTLAQLEGKHNKRLVFFIDDLDRCEPEKAVAVLEAIKLFLSNEHTVFVLGVDDQVIQAGLKQRYGDWLLALSGQESGNPHGPSGVRPYHLEYLEKIIQLPFTLPALTDSEVGAFVHRRLHQDLRSSLAVELIRQGCEYNPRKLNRLCHLLNLNWDMARERKLRQRLVPEILIKLVIIQLRHRSLYHDLLNGRSPVLRRLEEAWKEEHAQPKTAQPERAERSHRQRVAEDNPDIEAEESEASEIVESSGRSASFDPWIAPYVHLDWLRDLLLWQPPRGIDGMEACMTFRELAQPDNDYSIEEHIQLKPLETLAEVARRSGTRQPPQLDASLLQDLLHEDLEIIEAVCNRIAAVDRATYANYLVDFLGNPDNPWRQRVSAGDALGFLGDPRFAEGKESWVEIPAGEFYRGSRKEDDPNADDDEIDGERYRLDGYEIGRYPVTNAEYRRFVEATGHKRPKHWREGDIPLGQGNHPVVFVSWVDANAYVEWLDGRNDGYRYALPSEAQWERAARGPAEVDGRENRRIYPWGDEFNAHKCNVGETGLGRTTAVGCFPDGASVEGVLDLSGNVFEWCLEKYGQHTYVHRVVRGGSWGLNRGDARAAYRSLSVPDLRDDNLGFRVVRRPPS